MTTATESPPANPSSTRDRPSVVFVDDEPRVLDGLRRSLFTVRHQWDIRTASSGEEALAMLQVQPAQIVVSDLQMPSMDGLVLLERVADTWPETVRVILSGQENPSTGARAWTVAHQYLSKPCDARTLLAALERANSLVALLQMPAIRAMAGRLQSLPTTPSVLMQLEELTSHDAAATSELAAIITRDTALTAKVLQVVNSAFFGLRRQVLHVETAVSVMGFQLLKALIIGHEIGHAFPCFIPDWDPEAAHDHSITVATLAKTLGDTPLEDSDLFTAGILHDVGKLVMASRAPELFVEVLDDAARTYRPLHEVERLRHGVDHADVGAYLLGLWGLPWPLVEAVGLHHSPHRWNAASTTLAAKLGLVQEVLHERELAGTNFLAPQLLPPEAYSCLGDAATVHRLRELVRDALRREAAP
jgi:HD-like signal output (HDOD) protein